MATPFHAHTKACYQQDIEDEIQCAGDKHEEHGAAGVAYSPEDRRAKVIHDGARDA